MIEGFIDCLPETTMREEHLMGLNKLVSFQETFDS